MAPAYHEKLGTFLEPGEFLDGERSSGDRKFDGAIGIIKAAGIAVRKIIIRCCACR
jgi:hypothetical protein